MPQLPISPTSAPEGVPADLLAALDAGSVQRLRDLDPSGTQGLLRRVLAAFADSLHQHLDELGAARAAGDGAAIRRVSHTLKSSAASVGALELARTCTEIEGALRERPTVLPEAAVLDGLAAQLRRLLVLAGRAAPATP